MKTYKILKVFDCQDMPEDLRHKFFAFMEKGNERSVSWKGAICSCKIGC